MEDWQELAQTVVLGLMFSYFVAKLISTVVHFREDNLKVVRENDLLQDEDEEEEDEEEEEEEREEREEERKSSSDRTASTSDERDFVVSGGGGGRFSADRLAEEDDEDDWEGVESTELDEVFSAATAFVAATAADRSGVSNDVQLELYGLYKIATEGPCTAPQPSALKMTARAKWNAWHKLGAMPPEEAMEKYILIVNKLYPSWSGPTSDNQKEGRHTTNLAVKGSVGPVFSSFIHEEHSDNELKLEDIHVSAREGKTEDLKRYLEDGISVNLSDSEGRTPLHWAVDRGHLHVVEILVYNRADLNAKDNEGQTALHYAVLCERKAIAELLVKHGASCIVKDGDGNSPSDLGGSAWNFMTSALAMCEFPALRMDSIRVKLSVSCDC